MTVKDKVSSFLNRRGQTVTVKSVSYSDPDTEDIYRESTKNYAEPGTEMKALLQAPTQDEPWLAIGQITIGEMIAYFPGAATLKHGDKVVIGEGEFEINILEAIREKDVTCYYKVSLRKILEH